MEPDRPKCCPLIRNVGQCSKQNAHVNLESHFLNLHDYLVYDMLITLADTKERLNAVFRWFVFFYVRVLNTRQWTSLRVLSTPYVYVRKNNASLENNLGFSLVVFFLFRSIWIWFRQKDWKMFGFRNILNSVLFWCVNNATVWAFSRFI